MKKFLLSIAAFTARVTPVRLKKAIYRYPWLSERIRNWLNKAAPQGLTEVSVAAGALQGAWLSLDMQSEKDYWLGTYEPELQAAILDFVKPGMVAYDIGANIGYISLQLGRVVGDEGHVYAFEALPENYERLLGNISRNGMDDCITVLPLAVTDNPGEVTFLAGPSVGTGKVFGSSGRRALHYKQEIKVEAITLDGFVYDSGNPAPNVIKMDIEGGELLAVPGMSRVLSEARPLVLIELHGYEAAYLVWDELQESGYQIYRMALGYEQVSDFDDLDWKSYLVAKPG
jgi:FkbM family methyltransferase